jgi:hypothetical protein
MRKESANLRSGRKTFAAALEAEILGIMFACEIKNCADLRVQRIFCICHVRACTNEFPYKQTKVEYPLYDDSIQKTLQIFN